MGLLPQGLHEVAKSGRLSVMNHLATDKMDQLMALGYGDTNLTAGTHPNPDQYRLLSDPDLSEYSVRWIVTDNQPVLNMKTVVVEVGYLLWNTDGSPILPAEQQFQLSQNFVFYRTP